MVYVCPIVAGQDCVRKSNPSHWSTKQVPFLQQHPNFGMINPPQPLQLLLHEYVHPSKWSSKSPLESKSTEGRALSTIITLSTVIESDGPLLNVSCKTGEVVVAV